ncbi:hypothetical protein [Halosimplex halobium]|uniref:hypothetical protein n=1 Tax=Halosimplex halobium TaxID=3396618 RepID=UPI003F57BB5D
MGEKLTRRAALACIGSGALAMGLGSSAFESVEAGRSVSVDVAGDGQTAFLEIENLGNTVNNKNRGNKEETNILEIRNNFDQELSSLDVSVSLGSGIKEATPFDDTVSGNGGTTTYSAWCDGNSGGGTTTATVTVTSAEGSTVEVSDASYSFDISRSCPGNGNGNGNGTRTVVGDDEGDVEVSGDVIVTKKSNVNGSIDAGGSVTVEKKATLQNITSGGDVEVQKNTSVNGTIDSGGNVTIDKNTSVNGVTAAGNVDIKKNTTINGPVDAGGNVTVSGATNPPSSIQAGGDVTVSGISNLNGNICADGDITVGKNVNINGSVKSKSGSVTMEQNSDAQSVVANGDVYASGSNVSEEDISEGVSDVQC